jgi:hypothetical protein
MPCAEGWILHSRGIGGEVAALALEDGTRLGGTRSGGVKPLDHGFRPGLPEMIEGGSGPGLRFRRVVAMDGFGNRPDVLAGVLPVDDFRALLTKQGGHVFPDPLGPIAQDHDGRSSAGVPCHGCHLTTSSAPRRAASAPRRRVKATAGSRAAT